MGNYGEHQFRCLLCGKAGIPLQRKQGHQHGRFHRKKLHCPYCKVEVNHIEIKNQEDLWEFLENWENGVYHDEAEESLAACRAASIG